MEKVVERPNFTLPHALGAGPFLAQLQQVCQQYGYRINRMADGVREYAVGSLTIPDGSFLIVAEKLELGPNDVLQIEGDAVLRIV